MTASHRLAGMLVAIVVFALGAATPAAAQDRDAQEVSRYTLTEAGLAKFAQATRNISALPGACERKEDDDSDDLKSIDQMVAKLNSVPGIQAAIQSAGFHVTRIRRVHVLDDAERHGGLGREPAGRQAAAGRLAGQCRFLQAA